MSMRAVVEEEGPRAPRSSAAPTRMVDGLAITVLPMPYHMQAIPAPRRDPLREPASLAARALNPLAAAQRRPPTPAAGASRHACRPTLARSTCPVGVARPARMALRPAELERVAARCARPDRRSALRARGSTAARRSRGRRRRSAHWCRRRASARAHCGTKYGPEAWIGTRLATVFPHEAYAPVLKSPRNRTPSAGPRRRTPSARASRPDGAWWSTASTRAACRHTRTGRSSFHAATASSGWIAMSSLPPKPPPIADGTMCTCSGSSLQDARDLVAVHVGRLRAGEDADAAERRAARVAAGDDLGIARLGLDVGVLDVAGRERSPRPRARRRPAPRRRRRGRRGRGSARCREARVQRRASLGGSERFGDRFMARRAAGSRSAHRLRRSPRRVAARRPAPARPRRESARRRRRAPAGPSPRERSRSCCPERRRR